jgi:hypothetical protein
VGGGGELGAGGFGSAEELVDLVARSRREADAEVGRAGLAGREAGVLREVVALVQAEHQVVVEAEEGGRPVGTGDLVVELPADDAVSRPAQAVAVERDRTVQVVYGQGDEEYLRAHHHSSPIAGAQSRVPCLASTVPSLGTRQKRDRRRPLPTRPRAGKIMTLERAGACSRR